jgi:hypothetical protein
LREPEWGFDFPGREQKPGFLRGLLARPFLREYFPEFEIYVWIDADAWLQDWYAVELFCEGACRRRGMAIVPEIDRGSQRQFGGLPVYWTPLAALGGKYCTRPASHVQHNDRPTRVELCHLSARAFPAYGIASGVVQLDMSQWVSTLA